MCRKIDRVSLSFFLSLPHSLSRTHTYLHSCCAAIYFRLPGHIALILGQTETQHQTVLLAVFVSSCWRLLYTYCLLTAAFTWVFFFNRVCTKLKSNTSFLLLLLLLCYSLPCLRAGRNSDCLD